MSSIERSASTSALESLRTWLHTVVLPAEIVVAFPAAGAKTLFAFEVGTPSKGKGGRYTFRKNQTRASVEIQRSQTGDKFRIDRFDAPFLLTRSGASSNLLSTSATVVGCGSVGSFVAFF